MMGVDSENVGFEHLSELFRQLYTLLRAPARKLGVSRREFLGSSGGMAASFLAMNDVFGEFFKVDREEIFEPRRPPPTARRRTSSSCDSRAEPGHERASTRVASLARLC
jgi:hypothetical protein